MYNYSGIYIEVIELFSRRFAIPSLGFATDFLGVDISIGAFMNFVLEAVDIKIMILIISKASGSQNRNISK